MAQFNIIKKELDYREYCENNSEVLKTFYEILEQYPNNDENKDYFLEGNLPETHLQIILETHSIVEKEWTEPFEIRNTRTNMPWESNNEVVDGINWKIDAPSKEFTKEHLHLLKSFQSFLHSNDHFKNICKMIFGIDNNTSIHDWFKLKDSNQHQIIDIFFRTLYNYKIPLNDFYYFDRKGKYGQNISWKKYTFRKFDILNFPNSLNSDLSEFDPDITKIVNYFLRTITYPVFRKKLLKSINIEKKKSDYNNKYEEIENKILLNFNDLDILKLDFKIIKKEILMFLKLSKFKKEKVVPFPFYKNNKIEWIEINSEEETKDIESEKNELMREKESDDNKKDLDDNIEKR